MPITPGEVHGREGAGLEAAIGVGEGREHKLRIAHALQHSRADRISAFAASPPLASRMLRPSRSTMLACTCRPEPAWSE